MFNNNSNDDEGILCSHFCNTPAPSSRDHINKAQTIKADGREKRHAVENKKKREESKLPTWSRWMQGSEVRLCDLLLD